MTTAHLIVKYPWTEKSYPCEKIETNPNVQEIANKELREDEKTKEQCLRQIREWINQNKDIQNCLIGTAISFF